MNGLSSPLPRGDIVGEIYKQWIHWVSRSTARIILKEEGAKSSPKRGNGFKLYVSAGNIPNRRL